MREIDLTIALMPGTNPISKAPNKMTPAKLRELKVQLEDPLDEAFIYPECFSVGKAFPFHEEERWHLFDVY